jgi:hypothetical protein
MSCLRNLTAEPIRTEGRMFTYVTCAGTLFGHLVNFALADPKERCYFINRQDFRVDFQPRFVRLHVETLLAILLARRNRTLAFPCVVCAVLPCKPLNLRMPFDLKTGTITGPHALPFLQSLYLSEIWFSGRATRFDLEAQVQERRGTSARRSFARYRADLHLLTRRARHCQETPGNRPGG